MSDKSLISVFSQAPAATENTFASENFNTVLYTGTGAAQRIGGYINRGAKFNGSSSKIDIDATASTPLDFSSETFTISAWINGSGFSTDDRTIISKYSGSNDSTSSFIFDIRDSDQKLRFSEVNGTSVLGLQSSDAISENTWTHVVYVRTATTCEFFINGASSGGSQSRTTAINSGGTTDISIGERQANKRFIGTIDQVRLFDKALSSSEVTTLYNETHASTTKSTTDIFDDGSGVALYQLDGNANDTGGVSGKFDGAAHFNGSSSGITNGDIAVNTSNNWSVSFWAYSNKDSAYQRMVQFGSGNTNFIIQKRGDNNKVRLFSEVSGGTKFDVDGAVLNTTGWNHIVATGDGTTAKLYVNNATAVTDTIDGTSNMSGLYIGKRDTSAEYFDGRIDDLRIYSDVLTSAEVGYIYNNTTASIPTDNLVAHYKFNGDARDETTSPSYDGVASNVKYAYDGTASNIVYQEATKFTPDLVWIKARETANSNALYDSVRGATKQLSSDLTNAEGTYSTVLSSFDSNGFTVETSSIVNTNGDDYVAWCFNAGTDAAASNTDGSITSTVKANPDAGFSIVKFTKTAGNSTVGHGLGVKPSLVITKKINGTGGWTTYTDVTGSHGYLQLNTTAAFTSYGSAPNTSTFNNFNDTNDEVICYVFADVDGYQKIGSYTGTGASGNMVETDFEVGWILIKKTTSASSFNHWYILDVKRDTDGRLNKALMPSLNNAEATYTSDYVDVYSNGFSPNGGFNTNGVEHIYLAIAADPDETTPTVENSFDVVTYSGTGSSRTVEVDFKPDLVWIKDRGRTREHIISDSVRGVNKEITSSTTDAEESRGVSSFDSNAFSFSDGNTNYNESGQNYVAWCWKANDHDDNLPEINTNGTIDSTVSVNDAAGFSIVKWYGNSGHTVGHGLSQAPDLIISKITNTTDNWFVYQRNQGSGRYLVLNSNAARVDSSGFWGTVDSETFRVGDSPNSYDHIAYCWYSVSGHSKIGTYSGSGASGNAQALGFAPRWVMLKSTNAATNWAIFDTNREGKRLQADLANAEGDDTRVTLTSTGFEFTGTAFNESGRDWIYMAFK